MTSDTLSCQDEQRRHAVRDGGYNGIDYVEVLDDDDQRELCVHFLDRAPEETITPAHVVIRGGRRIRDIRVLDVEVKRAEYAELDDCLIVRVDRPGDFSTYELCLVDLDEKGRPTDQPFPNFDVRYYCASFGFKQGCPSEIDCLPDACPPEQYEEPVLDYLAKDYASFRRLILDRLAVVMPEWQERHVPDIGIALVEVFAYAGDYLSYYQDAVATEAYLDTARRRISVRRHVRLVDYLLHEGCNARAWVHVETSADITLPAAEMSFITGYNDALDVNDRVLRWDDLRQVPSDQYEVFAPLPAGGVRCEGNDWQIALYVAHNTIRFYTWGDGDCCLPRGATSATLIDGTPPQEEPPPDDPSQQGKDDVPSVTTGGRALALNPGDVLIFEEVLGPSTGNPADADPRHRHAVRLTGVEEIEDPLTGQPLLEVTWDDADALPFPLCISASRPAPDCGPLDDISVARGNVILVDHGRRVPEEDLGCVPLDRTDVECGPCGAEDPVYVPGRFRPRLARGPVTYSQPLVDAMPAARALVQDPRQALPWVCLSSWPDPDCWGETAPWPEPEPPPPQEDEPPGEPPHDPPPQSLMIVEDEQPRTWWEPRLDLLGSGPDDFHYVVEVDNEARAWLRFGDGELGRRPEANHRFEAAYRVGNGPAGNVGAESISHVVLEDLLSGVQLRARNPLPAAGGIAPEPIAEVKLFAPYAFRHELQRAITAEDYAAIVMRDFADQVQRAVAVLRWTGSAYRVLVAVDARGTDDPEPELLQAIGDHLYHYRRIGHDVTVQPAGLVSLDIALDVCVDAHHLRGHVRRALLDLFGNRPLADGSRGLFHPDNLTFGEGIHLSRLVAAAQAVPGVDSVSVTRLQRQFEAPAGELEAGLLPLGPLEVARLDNDPSFPEHGRLELHLRGGR